MKKISLFVSPSFLWNHLVSDVITAYQFAQILRYIQNVLLSIILVRSGMNLSDIGSFEILIFLVTLFSQFWISGFKEGLVSKAGQLSESEKDHWIIKSFAAHIIVGSICAILLIFAGPLYLAFESNTNASEWLLLCGLLLCFQAWGQLAETILLIRKRAKLLFFYSLISGFGFIILLLAFLCFFTNLTSLFILLICFYGFRTIFAFLLLNKEWSSSIIRYSLEFIKWSLPFLGISVLGFAMEALDGFLVIHFFDDSTFPLYKYGARELPLSALLMSSLSVAMMPVLNQSTAIQELKRRANYYMHGLYPLTIILIWVSSYLFSAVYGEEFLISAQVFNIYLLIIGSRLLMPHSILLARGKEKVVMWSGVAELLANVVLSLLMYSFWGLLGLVFATVVSYYFHKIFLLWFSYKYFRIRLNDLIHIKWWFVYQVLAFISVFLTMI